MYSFEEIYPDDENERPCSFAYWLCRLRKEPKGFEMLADNLQRVMSFHYDVEEQAYTPEMLNSSPKLIPKYLAPIAPVTLAAGWSPFPMARAILGRPEQRGIAPKGSFHRGAFAVWKPRYLGMDDLPKMTAHEKHFVFLLRLAASAALAAKCRILLVGSPGWSYEHAVKNYMNPETSVLMHEAGYLFTERVAR